MPTLGSRLKACLEENRITYESIHHSRDFTAQETAAHTHTRGKEFAKTVVLIVDGRFALAVLPAHFRVSLPKLKATLRAQEIRLASEDEIEKVCPDCEAGAVPPFGNLYDMPIYVSPIIARDEKITFNAGTHEDAVRMRYEDFERLAKPQVFDFAE